MSAKDSPPTIPEYISQADIDALLQGAGAVQAADDAPGGPQLTAAAGDADEVVISQADIDALLQGAGAHDQKGENGNPPGADHASPNADGGSGEEIFISQADIDALIKSESVVASADIASARSGLTADPDAQTAVADEARPPASQNQPGRDGQKAEALPPSPSGRDGAAPQKVILAASDGEQPPPLEACEDKAPARGRWLFSRTLWTVAAVLLILMSTVTSFYFYKHQTPSRGAATGPQAFPISQTSAAAQAFDPSGAAGLTLKGFVVPAPPDKKGVAGLIVDVELALFDAAGAAEIKKYEPYFRSLVYGSLFDALADPKHPEIDELALMARIKNSLNRALPQENIRRVALANLRLL
jgi:flagellar basal body-associated protein FliL